MAEVNGYQEDQAKLQVEIKRKDGLIEALTNDLQNIKNQTSIKGQEIRKLKEDFLHSTALKGEYNR